MIDLAGIEGSYVAAAALSRRARRICAAVITVCVLAALGWSATLVVAGGPGEWWSPLLTVLPGLAAGAGPLVGAVRPPRTQLDVQHLVVRTGPFTERAVAWGEVVAVRPPGRWDVHSTATLRDGTALPLPGLDLQRAQRLADAVARTHSPDAPATGVGQAARQRSPSSPTPRRGGPAVVASPGAGAGAASGDVPQVDLDWQGPFRTRPAGASGGTADGSQLR